MRTTFRRSFRGRTTLVPEAGIRAAGVGEAVRVVVPRLGVARLLAVRHDGLSGWCETFRGVERVKWFVRCGLCGGIDDERAEYIWWVVWSPHMAW